MNVTLSKSHSARSASRAACELRLVAAAERAGISLDAPLDSPTAFALLVACGFAATQNRFHYHLRRGYLTPPARVLGRYAWCLENLVDFAESIDAHAEAVCP